MKTRIKTRVAPFVEKNEKKCENGQKFLPKVLKLCEKFGKL